MANFSYSAIVALLSFSLSACGGGGGGPAAVTSATQIPVATASSSYAITAAASALTLINGLRQGAGLTAAVDNDALDKAASNHLAFLVVNQLVTDAAYLRGLLEGILGGHYEMPGKQGYTGKSPQDRATFSGYSGPVTELVSLGAVSGADCVTSLENSAYHLIGLIAPLVDIGVGFNIGNGSGNVCAVELGVPATTVGKLPVDGSLVVYPYSGQMAVTPIFYNQAEIPVPVPDILVAGHPVAVSLYSQSAPSLAGSDIVVHSFSMVQANGTPISARLLTTPGVTSDGPDLRADSAIMGAGYIVLIPANPLAPNMVHTVKFSAIVKGRAVAKSWSFTTGTGA